MNRSTFTLLSLLFLFGGFVFHIQANEKFQKHVYLSVNDKTSFFDVKTFADFKKTHGSEIISIKLNDSVQAIENYMFANCKSLSKITFSKKIQTIGSYAFQNCVELKGVKIPDSIQSVGWYAFDGCSNLEKISLSKALKEIGNYAFYGCLELKSVQIPGSVKSIGDMAFYGCSCLSSVTFKSLDISFGKSVFSECGNLNSINIETSNAEEKDISHFLNGLVRSGIGTITRKNQPTRQTLLVNSSQAAIYQKVLRQINQDRYNHNLYSLNILIKEKLETLQTPLEDNPAQNLQTDKSIFNLSNLTKITVAIIAVLVAKRILSSNQTGK